MQNKKQLSENMIDYLVRLWLDYNGLDEIKRGYKYDDEHGKNQRDREIIRGAL